MDEQQQRVPCVGAIVADPLGRLLLVERGHPPHQGCWSLPGGRVEPGETHPAATVREVLEETGLHVEVVGAPVGEVELALPGGVVALVVDYRCRPLPSTDLGAVRGGDDAANADWFTAAQVRSLPCSPGLVHQLEEWGVLAPP